DRPAQQHFEEQEDSSRQCKREELFGITTDRGDLDLGLLQLVDLLVDIAEALVLFGGVGIDEPAVVLTVGEQDDDLAFGWRITKPVDAGGKPRADRRPVLQQTAVYLEKLR